MLRCLDQWKAPTVQADPFAMDNWQRVFTRGEGLPGSIWASGKSAWVADVTLDANFTVHRRLDKLGFTARSDFHI